METKDDQVQDPLNVLWPVAASLVQALPPDYFYRSTNDEDRVEQIRLVLDAHEQIVSFLEERRQVENAEEAKAKQEARNQGSVLSASSARSMRPSGD